MKTMLSFRTVSQGILAGIALAAFVQSASSAQILASAKQPDPKAITAPASESLMVLAYQIPGTPKVKVHIHNLNGDKLSLRLKDANGNVIYTEIVSTANYIRRFNLEALPDGNYVFEVGNGAQRIQKFVDLQTVTARNMQVQ